MRACVYDAASIGLVDCSHATRRAARARLRRRRLLAKQQAQSPWRCRDVGMWLAGAVFDRYLPMSWLRAGSESRIGDIDATRRSWLNYDARHDGRVGSLSALQHAA